MNFYTSAIQRGDNILYRGYENGKFVQRKVHYNPYLFVQSNKPSKYKTLFGDSVSRIDFDSIKDAKEFVETHKDVSNFHIYGQDCSMLNYVWIYDTFDGEIAFDANLIKTVYLDIEVASDDGFPKPSLADKEITAIGLKVNGEAIVFGCGSYKNQNVKYFKCENEVHLLEAFLKFWKEINPDVVTGWNVESFDIVYLVNRINKILGDNEAKRLSPWGLVNEKKVKITNSIVYDILGVSVLDYLLLYKKFTYKNQESYSLNHIAMVELGEKKVDYSAYGDLNELYRNNYTLFIDYNIKDVELVERLEDKLKLIELVYAMAYSAKVNYVDTFGVVKLWDVISHNFLLDRNIVVTPKANIPVIPYTLANAGSSIDGSSGEESFTGAYVKVPQVGMHHWVCSFDLNSLYPHIIMQYNISPETYVSQVPGKSNVDAFLEGEADFWDTPFIKTANRCLFRKDAQGFFPELMEVYYNKRKYYKNKMIEAEKKYQANQTYEFEKEISKFNNLQMAFKIMLNSAYGAFGNPHFRYYQLAFAECITLSGQATIRWIENYMNKYLNKLLDSNKDYVIASDTDSIYLNLSELVERVFVNKDKNITKIVDYLSKACDQKLQPYIDESYGHLAVYTNAYAQKMKMKRELIADKGIWTAKKRYILNVYDSEGVRYTEPKLKMMGIEAVKSSTPLSCRESIKKALKLIMTHSNQDLINFVAEFKKHFFTLPFEDIAFPRSCNNMEHYSNDHSIYEKGTPIQVKASLWYNRLIKHKKLEKKYPLISDGDKIKFSYVMPNKYGISVIASPAELPTELSIHHLIDYETQFEKAFIEPLNAIAEKINWKTKEANVATLDSFFS